MKAWIMAFLVAFGSSSAWAAEQCFGLRLSMEDLPTLGMVLNARGVQYTVWAGSTRVGGVGTEEGRPVVESNLDDNGRVKQVMVTVRVEDLFQEQARKKAWALLKSLDTFESPEKRRYFHDQVVSSFSAGSQSCKDFGNEPEPLLGRL